MIAAKKICRSRVLRSSRVKVTSLEGKKKSVFYEKIKAVYIEDTRNHDAFNTRPLFSRCSFSHTFKRAYNFCFIFIVLYFCTFASYNTMTRNSCERMLLTCNKNPSGHPLREACISFILYFLLNTENEYLLAFSVFYHDFTLQVLIV